MPDISLLLVAGPAVLLGSVVQSSVGLGLSLVAAPALVIVDPGMMPGALLIATMTLPLLTMFGDWNAIHWRGLVWSLPARVPGALAGAWLVGALTPEALGAVVGVMVLLAVAATLWAVRIRIGPASLLTAGALGGVTGTATAIGGPPLALLYQHESAPRVRGTLGCYFSLGAVISMGALQLNGELVANQLAMGLALVPFVLAGFLAGRPLRARLGTGPVRTALLVVVSVSGVTLVARALLG
ncbi:sulfite exporter TauE/SafE family protein [Streptomyces sp. B6B3]|uniref:sulfite exporter TauE/SafE family protein n=1 Tax=Streptomyces sp. B6B3 TaxID=3153570 RepID=UPI00325C513C